MTTSTTLQLKTSKMKKRLSKPIGLLPAMLATLALMFALGFALRSTTMSWSYGVIKASLPLVHIPPKDRGYHRFQEQAYAYIDEKTPCVVLTREALLFGELEAFTQNFRDIRSRYQIEHSSGRPRTERLMNQITQWLDNPNLEKKIDQHPVVILLADSDIPMPLIIQTMARLKAQTQNKPSRTVSFDRVVLAQGLY